jgi:small subunit ribosomal protein S15
MSRSLTTTLRPLFHARPQPIASTSTLPSISHFSTTSPAFASRVKQNAKRKKTKVLSLRSARESEDSNPPDPVLGYSLPPTTSSRQSTQASTSAPINRWEGCRLQRTILTPEQVYSAPLSEEKEFIHGLSKDDQDVLFGAVPYTTVGLGGGEDAAVGEQERQVEIMKRILDLRNASKAGIEVVNRQRIVEEFGRKRVLVDGEWGYEGEPQSGGSEVQGKFNSFIFFFFFFFTLSRCPVSSSP